MYQTFVNSVLAACVLYLLVRREDKTLYEKMVIGIVAVIMIANFLMLAMGQKTL